MRMRTSPIPVLIFLIGWLPATTGSCQDGTEVSFTYGFSGCSAVTGIPGSDYRKTVRCILSTSGNNSDFGAESWSFCIESSNSLIHSITIEGTDAEERMDNGWEINEIVNEGAGAISAVLLSFRNTITLPPGGDVSLASVTLQGRIPADEDEIVSLAYLDGLRGSGRPVDSIVTYDGETILPELGACGFALIPDLRPDQTPPAIPAGLEAEALDRTIRLHWNDNGEADLNHYTVYRDGELLATGSAESSYEDNDIMNDILYTYAVSATDHSGNESPLSPSIEVAAGVSAVGPFLRGDANIDLRINIADTIWMLSYLFSGGPMPQCNAAANSNGDDRINVADPVYSLNWLFRGGPAPPPPSSCEFSTDPEDINLGCDQPSCQL